MIFRQLKEKLAIKYRVSKLALILQISFLLKIRKRLANVASLKIFKTSSDRRTGIRLKIIS